MAGSTVVRRLTSGGLRSLADTNRNYCLYAEDHRAHFDGRAAQLVAHVIACHNLRLKRSDSMYYGTAISVIRQRRHTGSGGRIGVTSGFGANPAERMRVSSPLRGRTICGRGVKPRHRAYLSAPWLPPP